ncbi:peptide deformylase [Limisalsivibrio acetivorans]|uniref:peptide deformylase n=1 Tax=Limisalsivibrio acetivorans TaxID=1304888 RepID=UPI0003B3EE72|nr:peptide deformylase [Limisalsivibrio acetivorans]
MDNKLPVALRGEKILHQRAERILDPTDPEIRDLAKSLLITMRATDGVGIAAPQVKVPVSLVIVESRPNRRYPDAPVMEPIIMVNPEITELWGVMDSGWEGCLSIPGLRGYVPRFTNARVKYETLTGELVEKDFEGFPARIVQHECDHLDGILFPVRIEDCSDILSEEEYRRRILKEA